jgi:hypothetical protein
VSLWQRGCFADALGKVFVGAIGFKRPKFAGGFFTLVFSLLPAPTSFGFFESPSWRDETSRCWASAKSTARIVCHRFDHGE